VLGVNSVPTSLKISYQKILINFLSRSLTMFLGMSCILNIYLKNNSTTYDAYVSVMILGESLVIPLSVTLFPSFELRDISIVL